MVFTILLADDSPTITKVFSLSLSRHQYEIRTACNATQALEVLESTAVDFCLVDIALPETDGLSFIRQLKKNPKYEHIKTILLTNNFYPVDNDLCLQNKVDSVLTKPFQPHELRSCLSALAPKLRSDSPAVTASETIKQTDHEIPVDNPITAMEEPTNATEEEIYDIEKSASEWIADGSIMDLSEWESNNAPNPEQGKKWLSPGVEIVDTPEIDFPFSSDYIDRVAAKEGVNRQETKDPKVHEETKIEEVKVEEIKEPEIKEPEIKEPEIKEPDQQITEPASFSPEPVPVNNNTIDWERADLEMMVREETRKVCRMVVQKAASDTVPKLAEEIIREELERVLKTLETDPQ